MPILNDTLIVELQDAIDYCRLRGYSEPTEDSLYRAQDYIAGKYNQRFTVDFDNTDAPREVSLAIFEAAWREAESPKSLSPDITMGDKKIMTGLDVIEWKPVKAGLTASDYVPRVSIIENLLAPIIKSANTVEMLRV